MKLNGRTVTDDEIAIDVRKAIEAYDRFQLRRRNSARRDGLPKGGPDFEFDKAIRSRLASLEADFPRAGMLLGSKQTFSVWRNAAPKTLIKRKRSVLIAVLSVTGVDISAQGILARQPLNMSPMSELAPLKSRKLTNDPDEIDEVTFEIELAELIFKSSEAAVMSEWIAKPIGKLEKVPAFELGTVVFGLKEADIRIDFGETVPVEWTRRISAETDPFLGRADACVIIWSQERSTWIVQPTEGSPMRVRAENVKLCKIRGRRGTFVEVTLTAVEDQVFSDFRMRRQLNERGEVEPAKTDALAGEQLRAARERLFSIVLAHRPEEAAILSYQRHKLP